MECTIEIHLDGEWIKAGSFASDAGGIRRGIAGGGRFDYDIDYVVARLGQGAAFQVGCRYPVDFTLYREGRWPAFLLDLLPSGAGRRVWVSRLGLRDDESADWQLLLNAAGNPPGNLRIAEAALQPQLGHPGFERQDIVGRQEDFIEYAERCGAMVAGATDVQGDAPKFLLVQDRAGRWHADGALPDPEAVHFWLVKFPRGKTEADRAVLRNEAAYYEVARQFGVRVGGPLDLIDTSLFVPRFDRALRDGQVVRFGLETLASAAGVAEFGKRGSHLVFCRAIAAYTSDPTGEICEYLRRDILNSALRNTDNHGRNTALIKYPDGRILLSPLYDFAPMFLDPEGIPRASRWEGNLEPEIGRPAWAEVARALGQLPCLETGRLFRLLAEAAPAVAGLPEVMDRCGVEDWLIERLAGRIGDIARDLAEAAAQGD